MMKTHERQNWEHGGRGITSWITPVCSCGWSGQRHYAYDDYQHTNAKEEFERHVKRHRAEDMPEEFEE